MKPTRPRRSAPSSQKPSPSKSDPGPQPVSPARPFPAPLTDKKRVRERASDSPVPSGTLAAEGEIERSGADRDNPGVLRENEIPER